MQLMFGIFEFILVDALNGGASNQLHQLGLYGYLSIILLFLIAILLFLYATFLYFI
jgi:hypothetical protein